MMLGKLASQDNVKKFQWIFYGIFYAGSCFHKQLDAEAKKRTLPRKLQGTANAFAEAAYQFNGKAQLINDGSSASHVTNFKASAKHFKESGIYFQNVGELLVELVQNANLTRLLTKAGTFQNAANQGTQGVRDGFKWKADRITDPTEATDDPAKAALDTFKEAIETFKGSATKFKDFADAMSTPSRTELVYLATVFKDKAAEFASQAKMFHEKAQLIIGDKVTHSGIQDKFKTPAAAFGKVTGKNADDNGAANAFYEAIKFLAGS